ncbi:hypothetical protein VM98_35585, partial [Streptomyces rubellomurinus subsp. indigoferus]
PGPTSRGPECGAVSDRRRKRLSGAASSDSRIMRSWSAGGMVRACVDRTNDRGTRLHLVGTLLATVVGVASPRLPLTCTTAVVRRDRRNSPHTGSAQYRSVFSEIVVGSVRALPMSFG